MLERDVLTSLPTKIDEPTIVVLCESSDAVYECAKEVGKRNDVTHLEHVQGEEAQQRFLDIAVAKGKWLVIDTQTDTDTLRWLGRTLLPRPITSCHPDYRTFIIGVPSLFDRLPTMLRSSTIQVQTPLDKELQGRRLAQAAEHGNVYQVKRYKRAAAFFSMNDQVALMSKCINEESMLAILEHADISSVNSDGVRFLDVALEKRYLEAVVRICELGGKSDMVDLPELAKSETHHLLDAIVNSVNVPFDELTATHNAAESGNEEVLRVLFDARCDRDFHYNDYPLGKVVTRNNATLTQLIIDRMERVGLHPFRTAHISLYFLLQVLEEPGTLTDFISDICSRFCKCIIQDGALPCPIPAACIEKASQTHPDLMGHLLVMADVKQDAAAMVDWYLKRLPAHPQAAACLTEYLSNTSPESLERPNLLKKVVMRGEEASGLIDIVLNYVKTTTIIDVEVGGEVVQRTPLMLATLLPGFPEAAEMILNRDKDPNAVNEVGLNVLQQAVVDMTMAPLMYLDHLSGYAKMFRMFIEAGVDTVVSKGDGFSSSLFGYCQRYELAPVCFELLQVKEGASIIQSCSPNLRACMINYEKTRVPSEETTWFVPRAKLYIPGRPSLASLDNDDILRACAYLDPTSLTHLGLTCKAYHYLTSYNEFWDPFIPEAHRPLPSRRLIVSSKHLYTCLTTNTVHRMWLPLPDEETYECLFTGEQISKKELLATA